MIDTGPTMVGDAEWPLRIDSNRRRWLDVVDIAIPGLVFLVGTALGVYLPYLAWTITPQLPGAAVGTSDHYNSNVSDPPLTFWLVWALPPLVVYGVGGIVFGRFTRCRWFLGAFWAGFTPIFVIAAPIALVIDLGGF